MNSNETASDPHHATRRFAQLIVAGSVEERMLGLQRRKRELAEGLLSNESGPALTEADAEDLFAPLSE